MFSEKTNAVEYEIEGNSLDECKDRLYRQYGSGYQIRNFKV